MQKTIIIESEQQQTDYRLRCAIREVQNSYKLLRAALKIDNLPPLEEINGQWLADYIEAKIKSVVDTGIIPPNTKVEINKSWMATKRLAAKYVGAIIRNKQAWPDAVWMYDQEIGNYYCANICEVVDKLCTRIVPDEATTHLELCAKAFAAIQDLRAWEQEQDCVKLPLERLAKMDDGDFSEMWATGRAKVDHGQDTEALRTWRDINNKRFL